MYIHIHIWIYTRCANTVKGTNTKCKDFHGQNKPREYKNTVKPNRKD